MVRGKAKEQAQVCWPLLCAARPMLLPIEEFALTGSRKLSGVLLISLPPPRCVGVQQRAQAKMKDSKGSEREAQKAGLQLICPQCKVRASTPCVM